MDTWNVADSLSTDLGEVRKVVVRIVAGEIAVATGPVAHIDVRRENGADVVVELNNGTLFVSQPEPDVAPLERVIKFLTESRRHRCTVTVTVPPEAQVELSTVSGDVIVSGVEGGSEVKTVSGDVTLNALRSAVDVKTVSGEVMAKDIAGEHMKLKSVSGDVAIVDGRCKFIDAKSVSGDVLLDLDLDPSGTYDLTTVSGNVAVRTIAEPNVVVEATTVSGRLTSDFGLQYDSKPGRKTMSQAVGSGGARLWVKTVSGDLRVLRGRAAA